jgi:hypothetical protein
VALKRRNKKTLKAFNDQISFVRDANTLISKMYVMYDVFEWMQGAIYY